MNDLRQAGFNEQEAWEQVRERYLFPPEESKKEPKFDSPWFELLHEVNDLQNKLLQSHSETE